MELIVASLSPLDFSLPLAIHLYQVELYYMILERLEKYQEALDVVRGKLGGKIFQCLC